ncbi:MAG: DUF1109 domain-containing protein [Pseudobdellovibrionaceae bacterium]|nr:DUF1109 domain-containing protein [Pseudobdellovibrionaceae bacterium]
MRENLFIETLIRDLKKAPAAISSMRLIGGMLLVSLVSCAIFILMIGLRFDSVDVMQRWDYWLELMLLFVMAIGGFIMAERSSVPGLWRRSPSGLLMLSTALLIFIGMLTLHPQDAVGPFEKAYCSVLIMTDGMLPLAFALYAIKRRAPTRPRLTMAMVLLGSFAGAVAVQHLICPLDDRWHLLVWHASILPLSLLFAWSWGRRILGW